MILTPKPRKIERDGERAGNRHADVGFGQRVLQPACDVDDHGQASIAADRERWEVEAVIQRLQ